jgi:hypothetical protein
MMSQQSRRELLAVEAPRYRAAYGADRKRILDEFVGSSGYHRKYALHLLNHPPKAPPARKKRQRVPKYSAAVQWALITCWHATNGICSKRLVPYLPELVAVLERHGEIQLDAQTKAQLLTLSTATADRLLRAERQRHRPHGLGTTQPGTLVKHAIPIRTFADWDDAMPGFVEVDLGAHCGESTHGEYLNSLTLTDITTTWTECLALRNRSQYTVHAAIVQARTRLPFPLQGLDSDNGTEFINDLLLRYCQQERLTFTRSRRYKKNDQAHVEQKNWSIVRQTVGYDRYEEQPACDALAALYEVVRLYTNFFQPCMKLQSKERLGSKVKKTYDTARTPYQRVQESEQVTQESKDRLQAKYRTLNPLALLQQIEQRQAALWKLAIRVRSKETAQVGVQAVGSLS